MVTAAIAVGAGTEDREETPASALSRDFAKISRHVWIGQFNDPAVGEPQRMDIERIGLAMLAELRAGNVVAPAAIVGGIVLDTAQRRTERLHGRGDIVAHPVCDRLGHIAAQRRRRRDCDTAAVPQYDSLKPHHIGDGAFASAILRWELM